MNMFDSWDNIEGWCTREKALKMQEYLASLDPGCVVELGVFGGKSLLALAKGTSARVIGIDPWAVAASLDGENDAENDAWWTKIDHDHMYRYTQELMQSYGCHHVELWRMSSAEAAAKFDDDSIDFLHQDSNHSSKISCLEVDLYAHKVKVGGIWVFDDTDWETTQEAQDRLVGRGYAEIYEADKWKVFQRVK